ncbi:hypothetical protein FNJ84_00405 [Paracoccus sp. M683]|uniref:hypothetical protein n=1 Tax=Paracoccus sp. M683 TaxID=2594268 RepID=UPI001180DCCC|nr:hypothetical protein [Paracoccus sp. M683]TRW99180.1 hypothetical protein FNJ84_00405 [Paracoccus sp. M683]
MSGVPRCRLSDQITREAGVTATCYDLLGNQPHRLRRGQVYTVDSAIRACDGALSWIDIPHEELSPGPSGKLFQVDATDCTTMIRRSYPDLDRRHGDDFGFDQGDPETHCRNVYFTAMATYELFRRALGRPVAWAFWGDGVSPPLRLLPFAQQALNAYYDRSRAEIGFGFDRAGPDSSRADARLIRFTALSSDVIAHEVTHALIDGLRPDYDLPVHPDVFAFHEAVADTVALLSRFERQSYLPYLLRESRLSFLKNDFLRSLAPQLGRLVRKSGLRTLDIGWTVLGGDGDTADLPRYEDATISPHARGGLLSSAVFEAFLRSLHRRIKPLLDLAAPEGSAVDRYLIEQVQTIAAATAGHFLEICIRALDYCPPASIRFSDYLRAMITADRLLIREDRHGYREELIDAFRRRGIYPEDIDVVSERQLEWNRPDLPTAPIVGLALSDLRFDVSPVLPLNAAEVRRQARALALAIDDDRRLAHELGLRDPGQIGGAGRVSAPMVTSIRPTLRVGRDGFIDFSIIAEVTQDRDMPVDDKGFVRHRGGATLIIGPRGQPYMIVRQRVDNDDRIAKEIAYVSEAIARRQLVLQGERYVVDHAYRRSLCGPH